MLRVGPPLLPFGVGDDLDLPAGPVKVDVRIEVLAEEGIDRRGVLGLDMQIAHLLADHGPVLGFHQSVVIGMPRARLGLRDQQFLQQTGHSMIDELAAIVGVKVQDHKRELLQNCP